MSSSSTQTETNHHGDKPAVAPRPLKTIHNKIENIDDLKATHTKELFEAKVKLKEMEAKLAHFHKKVKAVPYQHNEMVASSESEKKLAEALYVKDEELRNARRLHGQNLATIRRSHDKTVKELQNRIDAMEINIRELVPNS